MLDVMTSSIIPTFATYRPIIEHFWKNCIFPYEKPKTLVLDMQNVRGATKKRQKHHSLGGGRQNLVCEPQKKDFLKKFTKKHAKNQSDYHNRL